MPVLLTSSVSLGADLDVEIVQTLTEEEENDEKESESILGFFCLEEYLPTAGISLSVFESKIKQTFSINKRLQTVALEVMTPPPELS